MRQESSNKKEKAGGVQRLGNKIKSVDIFGKGIGFNIGGETSTH